jgi:hypothetical protein
LNTGDVTYQYSYDTQGCRRYKSWHNSISEGYFYDTGHPHPVDGGGRPLA